MTRQQTTTPLAGVATPGSGPAADVAPRALEPAAASAAAIGDAAFPLVRIRELRYRHPGASVDLLRLPALDVTGAGLIALVGARGPARSVLVELIAGIRRERYSGSLEVLGREWHDLRRDADRSRQLRRVGLLRRDDASVLSQTPRQALAQELADAGLAARDGARRIEHGLAAVGLASVADRRIAELSEPQRRRIAAARMLARGADLVIAEEPTAKLEPALAEVVLDTLRDLAGRVPVLVVTDDRDLARRCERTVVLATAPVLVPEARRRRVAAAPGVVRGVALPHAGFGRRLAALALDCLVGFVLLVDAVVVAAAAGVDVRDGPVALAVAVATLAFWWLYHAGLESSSRRATLGKQALGLAVVDGYGDRLSFAHASARLLATLVTALTAGIGYIPALFTRRQQTLHDRLAGTRVIRA